MEKILTYFIQYKVVVGLSLIYFAVVSYVGVFLILRRASLFGFVLSQVAQVSFLLGLAVAAQFRDHEHVYAMINRSGAVGGSWHFLEIDTFVIPITLLMLLPFIIAAVKGLLNKETLLVAGLLFFLAAYPLINKAFGGNDTLLAKAYFTEILYTPPDMFLYFLPLFLPLAFVLFLFRRQFALSGFDAIQAELHGMRAQFYNALFFFLAGLTLSIAVRILGTYVSMAALIVPGYVALAIARRMRLVIFATLLLSVGMAGGGFVSAFHFDFLPTEPILAIFFILLGGCIIVVQKIFRKLIA